MSREKLKLHGWGFVRLVIISRWSGSDLAWVSGGLWVSFGRCSKCVNEVNTLVCEGDGVAEWESTSTLSFGNYAMFKEMNTFKAISYSWANKCIAIELTNCEITSASDIWV